VPVAADPPPTDEEAARAAHLRHYPPPPALLPAPAYVAPEFAAAVLREAEQRGEGGRPPEAVEAVLRLRLRDPGGPSAV
jgi:hypothetical protein